MKQDSERIEELEITVRYLNESADNLHNHVVDVTQRVTTLRLFALVTIFVFLVLFCRN